MATPRDIARIRADPLSDFKVRSIVSCMKLDVPVDLESLYTAHSLYSQKEIEKRRFVCVRIHHPKFARDDEAIGSALVFNKGGIILNDFKSVDDSKAAARIIVPMILPHVVLKSKKGSVASKNKKKPVPTTTKSKIEAKRGRGRPKKN